MLRLMACEPTGHARVRARLHVFAAFHDQLSLREIHQLQHLLGLLPSASYHLFGAPIEQSMSPVLHNTGVVAHSPRGSQFLQPATGALTSGEATYRWTAQPAGFERLRLPHHYTRVETDDVQVARAKMAEVRPPRSAGRPAFAQAPAPAGDGPNSTPCTCLPYALEGGAVSALVWRRVGHHPAQGGHATVPRPSHGRCQSDWWVTCQSACACPPAEPVGGSY